MHDFKIGDKVYGSDWCQGVIVDITDDHALVKFETAGGGGTISFPFEEMVPEED